MTWVICPSEIYEEFTEMSPETDSEILTMSVAQNAYVLNKELKNLKLARSKTEVAFLLKERVNCIWCPTDLYGFSKNDVFLDKDFGIFSAASDVFLDYRVIGAISTSEVFLDILLSIGGPLGFGSVSAFCTGGRIAFFGFSPTSLFLTDDKERASS